MIRLAVAGANGRMGRCVLDLASRDAQFQVVASLEQSSERKLPAACDVLIDFTNAAGTIEWIDPCVRSSTPMVIGATGHDTAQLERITNAARQIPVVKAANFSVGVNVLLDVVGRVAAELGPEYDIEVVEAHHRNKIDAPSGTALAIVDELSSKDIVFGRHGAGGPRPRGQVAIHAVRMGDVVGQHEIHFSGPGETVTIRHAAHSRDTFAAGALRAAAWIVGRPPGLYSMRDVLRAK